MHHRSFEKMTETVRFRVTPEELFKIDEAAYSTNLTRSAYLRKIVTEKEIVVYDFTNLDQLTAEVGKIGVNMNQIARKLNQGGQLNRENAAFIKLSVEMIQESLRKLYQDILAKKER